MHELSITQSILDIALKHANAASAGHILDIRIVVGELSSNVDDSVQFYWDIIAKDTLAEGAKLHFRRVPAQLKCRACLLEYSPREAALVCPGCGSADAGIIAGEEFFVESIDVDESVQHDQTNYHR
jgi:hydrogenase nickel incorporation protein HypA/HybF